MKLTLSSGGGFTGRRKTHTIDTNTLDSETKEALKRYFKFSTPPKPKNFSEVWKLENGEVVSIDPDNLDLPLRSLYEQMSSQLDY